MDTFSYRYKGYSYEDIIEGVVFDDGTTVMIAMTDEPGAGNTFVLKSKGWAAVSKYFEGAPAKVTLDSPGGGFTRGTRRFHLRRVKDVTGFSGLGKVAEGVQFPDGTCVLRWCTTDLPRSTVMWDNVSEAVQVHGHDGCTVLEWLD